MYSPPLYLSYHQDIPKLDIFWPTDYDYFGIFQKKIFVFELKKTRPWGPARHPSLETARPSGPARHLASSLGLISIHNIIIKISIFAPRNKRIEKRHERKFYH